ncbi:hypothetical protein L2X99_10240 [Microbacterium sp. KUDC0406]|uniref:hypothetical protein n=1 Tax=Microbacterium sp. KUDC0406 TaxID=2909588 RepID=UPI001F1B6D74|nr:hypothetical protein [Microbacterium sp. KUDC0406]UJP08869.1 hypothetical protein L2X99_10240 [Microbacterium sp. KUDC0406]
MVLPAVGLDDQPPVDHEIDAPDARDVDLRLDADAQEVQTQAHERFEPALGVAACEVDQPAGGCRERSADAGSLAGPDESLVPGGFERGEEELVAVALVGVDERVLDLGDAQGHSTGAEVRGATAPVVGMRASRASHPHMRCGVIGQHPHAAVPQRRRTRERTSVGSRRAGGG